MLTVVRLDYKLQLLRLIKGFLTEKDAASLLLERMLTELVDLPMYVAE